MNFAAGPTSPKKSRAQTLFSNPISPRKPKPKMSLITANLEVPADNSKKSPVSPGAKHWTHVRAQVLGDHGQTPVAPPGPAKKQGLVSKAAGRLGFRQAAENVLGYGPELSDLMRKTPAPRTALQEEEARERRKFSREIKACLESCGKEETRRRLSAMKTGDKAIPLPSSKRQSSLPLRSGGTAGSAYNSAHELPPFAPLLNTLHSYVSAARAKRSWAVTLPWHSEVLNELGTAFLNEDTDGGGHLMAVEIFGIVVRTWAPARSEEELDRWLWICDALKVQSRPLRARAIQVFAELLDSTHPIPRYVSTPSSPLALQSFASALLDVAYAARKDTELSVTIWRYLDALRQGALMPLSRRQVCETYSHEMQDGDARALVEREILWIAVLRKLSCGDGEIVAWIAGPRLEGLGRFEPPPILHATPPLIIAIRRTSATYHIDALQKLRTLQVPMTPGCVLQRMKSHLIPEIQHLNELPGQSSNELATLCAQSMLVWLVDTNITAVPTEDDSFNTIHKEGDPAGLLYTILDLLERTSWRTAFDKALREFCETGSLTLVFAIFRVVLSADQRTLAAIAQSNVDHLWKRMASTTSFNLAVAADFLAFMQLNFPQLLYKPLFSCAAASKLSSVREHLKIIRTLCSILGTALLWTQAPPEMLALVCMGDAPKGRNSSTENPKPFARDKLGKSAVLLELIVGLRTEMVNDQKTRHEASPLCSFARTLEDRFVLLWQAQESISSLPFMRRCLLCQLILITRQITLSHKAPSWHNSVANWICDAVPTSTTDPVSAKQSEVYRECRDMLLDLLDVDARPVQASTVESFRTVLQTSMMLASQRLFAAFYLSAKSSDTARVSFASWKMCDTRANAREAALQVFLVLAGLEQCSEEVASYLRQDLDSQSGRAGAQAKLQVFFSLRHQIINSVWLSSRNSRAILRFPPVDFSFVPTELGSAVWVAPASQQDANLLQFGRVLPVDVRQRLLALGWSDDATVVTASDWERVPVTQLPLQHLEPAQADIAGGSSPMRALLRRHSSAEASPPNIPKRRLCFPPVVIELVLKHSKEALHQQDNVARSEWVSTISVMSRDDPAGLVRSLMSSLGGKNELEALQALKNIVFADDAVPPSVAFLAFNGLLGFVKTQVRSSGPSELCRFPLHLSVLATIAPHLCNFTFREIRKSKSDSLILPGESLEGIRLSTERYGQWLDVRSAQLRVLECLLEANPREAYSVKESTLQALPPNLIAGYIATSPLAPGILTLARNWLLLVHRLLSSLNRNYNDLQELEKYLGGVCEILEIIGVQDILVTAHCMRIFLLSATRFRRLFGSNRLFASILVPCFNVYSARFSCSKTRDCIEYTARGFLSVHMDVFAFQLCSALVPRALQGADTEESVRNLYCLLLSLTHRNTVESGVASGIKGLNDIQEREALIAMVNDKPEVEFSDMRSAADQRHARRLDMLAAEKYEASTFALEDVTRLFLTVIASEPSSPRSQDFLAVFVMMSSDIAQTSNSCARLVTDGVTALADIYCRPAAKRPLEPSKQNVQWGNGESSSRDDAGTAEAQWAKSQLLMVKLIEQSAAENPHIGRRHLVKLFAALPDLLRLEPGEAALRISSVIHRVLVASLDSPLSDTKTNLAVLQNIAPIYRDFHLKIPFAPILLDLARAIERLPSLQTDKVATQLSSIYLGPALISVAANSTGGAADRHDLAQAGVQLTLQLAIHTEVDPFVMMAGIQPSCALVNDLLLPLAQRLASVRTTDTSPAASQAKRKAVHHSWLRLLATVMRISRTHLQSGPEEAWQSRTSALRGSMLLQVLKLACVSAESAMSAIPGLWTEVAQFVRHQARGAGTKFVRDEHMSSSVRNPRVNDWVMWSTSRLLVHYKCPLLLDLRSMIQVTLTDCQDDDASSRPSSPGLSTGWQDSSPRGSGRTRTRLASAVTSPNTALLHQSRPSFSELSQSRNSSMTPRFPDAAPLQRGVNRGAIVHLMAAPTKVLTSMTPQTTPQQNVRARSSAKLAEMRDEGLCQSLETAVKEVRAAFGYGLGGVLTQAWSRHDALMMINEETRLLREEFSDVLRTNEQTNESVR